MDTNDPRILGGSALLEEVTGLKLTGAKWEGVDERASGSHDELLLQFEGGTCLRIRSQDSDDFESWLIIEEASPDA